MVQYDPSPGQGKGPASGLLQIDLHTNRRPIPLTNKQTNTLSTVASQFSEVGGHQQNFDKIEGWLKSHIGIRRVPDYSQTCRRLRVFVQQGMNSFIHFSIILTLLKGDSTLFLIFCKATFLWFRPYQAMEGTSETFFMAAPFDTFVLFCFDAIFIGFL